jgi:hypothetical protein
MLELLIVLGCVALLGGLSALVMFVPPLALAYTALGLCATGSLLGVPLGVAYHVVLRRELVLRGALPARWYFAPQRHHHLLDDAGRRRVLPWFYAGGAGFGLVVFGMMVAVVTLVSQFR